MATIIYLRRPTFLLNLMMLATLGFGQPFAFAKVSRPNIVLIMSDDHAYQAISAYGSKLTDTPQIDRLANEGMRFDRCYVTNSICGPSRACILTGKYSHKNGFYKNGDQFDASQVTFPKLLQAAGYQTAIVGKWHLGKAAPQGFDYWKILKGQGYYYQPKFIGSHGENQRVGYATELITEDALRWLRDECDTNRPFLLMVHHKAPHRPWDPDPTRLEMFKDRDPFPEPETLFDDYRGRASAARRATMTIAKDMVIDGPDLKAWDHGQDSHARDWFYNKMSVKQHAQWVDAYRRKNSDIYASKKWSDKALLRWKYQRYLQDYLACADAVDDSVGRILDLLDEQDLTDNTVVLYCSDQGFYLGEHGWFDKRFMYEQSLRTPLLIRWPGVIEPGQAEDRIVSNLDFAETFLELANIDVPQGMQGQSLVPILRGNDVPDWRSSFYYHYYEGLEGGHSVCEHYGVTDGTYKLIHYYQIDEWELFDLQRDPLEMTSVHGEPAYSAIQARLLEALQEQQTSLGVPAEGS